MVQDTGKPLDGIFDLYSFLQFDIGNEKSRTFDTASVASRRCWHVAANEQ